MRGLRVGAVILVLFVSGLTAGTLRADTTTTTETATQATTMTAPDTTTTETTTEDVPATEASTTTSTTSEAPATMPATTPGAITTDPGATGTLPAATTTAAQLPSGNRDHSTSGGAACPFVGGIAIVSPSGGAHVLGAVLRAAPGGGHVVSGGVGYGFVVSAASVELRASACGADASATAVVRSLSLFGGAVTAQSVTLGVGTGGSGIVGLAVGGAAVSAQPGVRMSVGDWGSVGTFADGGALSVRLLRRHGSLPAGSVVVAAFTALPQPGAGVARAIASARERGKRAAATAPAHATARAARAAPSQRRTAAGAPLTATPPLDGGRYVFPVVGAVDYSDTYGGFRADVSGNWHHGDDIFAPLGTPVVAIATGTLDRVGWEQLGGWRLWVRDQVGNEFYYAHLSGYTQLALHSNLVKAGEVIGFVGNTGDAFTTAPHLHFEVHPRSLLSLGYDGAVDPTPYLSRWQRLGDVSAPYPVHPPFPAGAVEPEAAYVWRELLAARGLTKHPPSPTEQPRLALPTPFAPLDATPPAMPADAPSTPAGGLQVAAPLPASLIAVLLAAAAAAVLRRRPRPAAVPESEPTIGGALERLGLVVRTLRARA